MSRRDLLVAAALVTITLVWGTTWAAIRIGLASLPPFAGVALRFAVGGTALLALAPVLGVRLGTSRREWGLWLLNGLFSFVLSYGIVYWAEQLVPSALAAILFATFPLWVALLAHLLLPDDRLTVRSLGGILVGFAGVTVIFSENLDSLALPAGETAATGGMGVAGVALVLLLSPLAAAVGSVAVKRWGSGIHPVSIAGVPMALTAVVMGAAWALFERDLPLELDAVGVGSVLYLGLFGSALTFWLYFWLLERLPASRLSLVTYLSPVVAVAVGTLFLGEPLTARVLFGSGLVVVGVVVTVQRRRGGGGRQGRKPRRSTAPDRDPSSGSAPSSS